MSLQSILSLATIVAITASTLIFLRFLWILPSITPQPPSPPKSSAKLLIVLGSGGHTAEMLRLLKSLNFEKYTRRTYIVSTGDTLSESKARQFEHDKTGLTNGSFQVEFIPRARKVGQSWFRSIRCVLAKPLPDAVLCNGPGTCVLICIAALIPRFFGVKVIKIIYVESFARVTAFSLSGKILLYLADRFLVQWPDLAQKSTRAEYVGIIV